MKFFDFFIDAMITGYGIYILLACFKLKSKGIIDQKFMTNVHVSPDSCRDLKGYVEYAYIRFLIPSIVVLLGGIAGLVNDFVISLGKMYSVVFVMVIASLIYILYVNKTGLKKFF